MTTTHVRLTVNGQEHEADVEPRLLLVHLLRDVFGLTGTHIGCDTSNCGACTVELDGHSAKSCTVLAVQADGSKVTTVEGLAGDGPLTRLQQAFLDHGAAQCGFCIPGQLMAAQDLLGRIPHPTVAEVQEGLAGNLCRCAGYAQISEAVIATAEEIGR